MKLSVGDKVILIRSVYRRTRWFIFSRVIVLATEGSLCTVLRFPFQSPALYELRIETIAPYNDVDSNGMECNIGDHIFVPVDHFKLFQKAMR